MVPTATNDPSPAAVKLPPEQFAHRLAGSSASLYVEGVQQGSMNLLGDLTVEEDKVLVF